MRSVIGQGRLVMAERFVQFSGLVDNCEFDQGEKKTTCMDLKGFWEMIYFQVGRHKQHCFFLTLSVLGGGCPFDHLRIFFQPYIIEIY